MLRRLAVLIFLALFSLNTVFVYELVQHSKLAAVSLALMATQPPPHHEPRHEPRTGVAPGMLLAECGVR